MHISGKKLAAGGALLALGARNLGAERVIVRIARGEGKVIGHLSLGTDAKT